MREAISQATARASTTASRPQVSQWRAKRARLARGSTSQYSSSASSRKLTQKPGTPSTLARCGYGRPGAGGVRAEQGVERVSGMASIRSSGSGRQRGGCLRGWKIRRTGRAVFPGRRRTARRDQVDRRSRQLPFRGRAARRPVAEEAQPGRRGERTRMASSRKVRASSVRGIRPVPRRRPARRRSRSPTPSAGSAAGPGRFRSACAGGKPARRWRGRTALLTAAGQDISLSRDSGWRDAAADLSTANSPVVSGSARRPLQRAGGEIDLDIAKGRCRHRSPARRAALLPWRRSTA